jgi:hypothetical protein
VVAGDGLRLPDIAGMSAEQGACRDILDHRHLRERLNDLKRASEA